MVQSQAERLTEFCGTAVPSTHAAKLVDAEEKLGQTLDSLDQTIYDLVYTADFKFNWLSLSLSLSLSLDRYIYIYVFIYKRIHKCVCMSIYIYMYMYMYIYIYVFIFDITIR